MPFSCTLYSMRLVMDSGKNIFEMECFTFQNGVAASWMPPKNSTRQNGCDAGPCPYRRRCSGTRGCPWCRGPGASSSTPRSPSCGKQQVDRRALEARLLDELHPGGLVRRHDGVAGGGSSGEELVVALHIHAVGRPVKRLYRRPVNRPSSAMMVLRKVSSSMRRCLPSMNSAGSPMSSLSRRQLVLLFRSDGVARDEGATVLLIDELPGAVEPRETGPRRRRPSRSSWPWRRRRAACPCSTGRCPESVGA